MATDWKEATMYALETMQEMHDDHVRNAIQALANDDDERTYSELMAAARALDAAMARVRGYAGL